MTCIKLEPPRCSANIGRAFAPSAGSVVRCLLESGQILKILTLVASLVNVYNFRARTGLVGTCQYNVTGWVSCYIVCNLRRGTSVGWYLKTRLESAHIKQILHPWYMVVNCSITVYQNTPLPPPHIYIYIFINLNYSAHCLPYLEIDKCWNVLYILRNNETHIYGNISVTNTTSTLILASTQFNTISHK